MSNTSVSNNSIEKAIDQAKAASDIYSTHRESIEEFNARMEREESEFFAKFND